MELVIEMMQPSDWPAVAAIYQEGIATGLATMETQVPDWETWDAAHLPECRMVARRGEQVLAWTALTRVSSRCVYEGVAEESIYVAQSARGQGVGRQLLMALGSASESAGYWTLQAGILKENQVSIRLHEACGFRLVGVRERLGRLHGQWRDLILMERRSQVVGI